MQDGGKPFHLDFHLDFIDFSYKKIYLELIRFT